MRVTLEKSDLVKLLGKALGYPSLSEEDVDVQAEPFEVHIHNVRLNELSATPPPSASSSAGTKAAAPMVPVATQQTPPSVEELMARNAELAGAPMIREYLAPGETYEPPDPDEERFLGGL